VAGVVTVLVCPKCNKTVGDDPTIDATNDDGTANDTALCFECWDHEFYGPAFSSQDERRP
jgi:hypothetical protein